MLSIGYMTIHHFFFFFFNDTATTEIYTLSLHDALPICSRRFTFPLPVSGKVSKKRTRSGTLWSATASRQKSLSSSRSEEHTSELQSRLHLVCRLLLEKKKKRKKHKQ